MMRTATILSLAVLCTSTSAHALERVGSLNYSNDSGAGVPTGPNAEIRMSHMLTTGDSPCLGDEFIAILADGEVGTFVFDANNMPNFADAISCYTDGVSDRIQHSVGPEGGTSPRSTTQNEANAFPGILTDLQGIDVVEVRLVVTDLVVTPGLTPTSNAFVTISGRWEFWADLPPSVEVTGSCPGQLNFDISNATPNAQVELGVATTTGSYVIRGPHPCNGTATGLGPDARPRVSVTTDSSGSALFSRVFQRASACDVFIQMLDVDTCEMGEEVIDLLP